MYQNINNIAHIDGKQGCYTRKITNPSVAYGRNAINNYKEYINDFKITPVQMPDLSQLAQLTQDKFDTKMKELDASLAQLEKQKMPPINFVCRYMPNNSIDTDALLGAAYEVLGDTAISTADLTQRLQETADSLLGKNKIQMSAQSLDINNDGNIDIGEYSSSILVEDALSTDNQIVDVKNINGELTNKGENSLLAYGNFKNYEIASATFRGIYEMYGLDKAKDKFLSNPNNLI